MECNKPVCVVMHMAVYYFTGVKSWLSSLFIKYYHDKLYSYIQRSAALEHRHSTTSCMLQYDYLLRCLHNIECKKKKKNKLNICFNHQKV